MWRALRRPLLAGARLLRERARRRVAHEAVVAAGVERQLAARRDGRSPRPRVLSSSRSWLTTSMVRGDSVARSSPATASPRGRDGWSARRAAAGRARRTAPRPAPRACASRRRSSCRAAPAPRRRSRGRPGWRRRGPGAASAPIVDQPLVDLGRSGAGSSAVSGLGQQRGALGIGGQHRLEQAFRPARRLLRHLRRCGPGRQADLAAIGLRARRRSFSRVDLAGAVAARPARCAGRDRRAGSAPSSRVRPAMRRMRSVDARAGSCGAVVAGIRPAVPRRRAQVACAAAPYKARDPAQSQERDHGHRTHPFHHQAGRHAAQPDRQDQRACSRKPACAIVAQKRLRLSQAQAEVLRRAQARGRSTTTWSPS